MSLGSTAPLVGSSDSILVVSPWLVLCVALAVISTDLLLHFFAPWVRIRLTTTADQRAALATHAARIGALRIQSNKLNSPATFAEYAKTQRALQKELKLQAQLQAQIGVAGGAAGHNLVHTAQQFALTYGLKIAVNLACFLACVGQTLFVVPTTGWMTALSYTPMRVSKHRQADGRTRSDVDGACWSDVRPRDQSLTICLVLSPLSLSLQLVLGEVGIIPWLVVCSTVSAALKTWL